MPIVDYPEDTVGMIRARRWADWVPAALFGIILSAVSWQAALVFLAVVITIRLETNRVLATIWPQCSHAVRKALEDQREPL